MVLPEPVARARRQKRLLRPDSESKPSLPKFHPFQKARLEKRVPAGDGWLFEMKYDGYRCQAAVARDRVRLYSSSGADWTDRFGYVAPALSKLTTGTLLLDGEICAIDRDGRSNFNLLQNALGSGGLLVYFVFDLLQQDGEDVARLPQLERKRRLEALLGPREADDPLQYSQHVAGHGQEVFRAMCEGGFEGVIAKSATARYYGGERSPYWLKIKCVQRQEFVVIGWRPPERGVHPVDVRGLHLATREGGDWVYRGRVGSGLSDADRSNLREAFDLIASEPFHVHGMPPAERRNCRWIEPRLLAEVAYTEITPDGTLRHPSFKGIREDKPAEAVHLEEVADG
jgi:bifunctional non-homologous end joining protein LigD